MYVCLQIWTVCTFSKLFQFQACNTLLKHWKKISTSCKTAILIWYGLMTKQDINMQKYCSCFCSIRSCYGCPCCYCELSVKVLKFFQSWSAYFSVTMMVDALVEVKYSLLRHKEIHWPVKSNPGHVNEPSTCCVSLISPAFSKMSIRNALKMIKRLSTP